MFQCILSLEPPVSTPHKIFAGTTLLYLHRQTAHSHYYCKFIGVQLYHLFYPVFMTNQLLITSVITWDFSGVDGETGHARTLLRHSVLHTFDSSFTKI